MEVVIVAIGRNGAVDITPMDYLDRVIFLNSLGSAVDERFDRCDGVYG